LIGKIFNFYKIVCATILPQKSGVESEHIWTIYKSKQGELWQGGASPSGVYRFNGISFERKY
jgi:hypothetical protein